MKVVDPISDTTCLLTFIYIYTIANYICILKKCYHPLDICVYNEQQTVDFDCNGVIDFEEFLHVMNEKRGGDSSFSAIVHKVCL